MKQRAVLLMLGLMPWAGLHAQSQTASAFKVTARVEAACAVTASDFMLRTICTPNSTDSIAYQIYPDAARRRTRVKTGLAPQDTVFGGVPAAQVLPAGGHADAITVRVYY
jgi:hypothetical protein